jgi:hypothetical protein
MPKTVTVAEHPCAPDQRAEPAPNATQLRLGLAHDSLAFILDLSTAVELTVNRARALQAEGEDEQAEGLFECAMVAQALVGYLSARVGEVMREVKPDAPHYVGDTASWLLPPPIASLLHLIERERAQ